MSIRLKYYILIHLLCLLAFNGLCQEPKNGGTHPSLELVEAREDIDYSKDVKKKEKEKKESSLTNFPNFNFSDVFGVLLIILLIGIVIAILYFILGKDNFFSPKSRKIQELNMQAVEQIEEDLENQDVASYLDQAIDKKQFRIAIRLHYLLIIKELSEKKLIKWKRDKTNRDYILESSSYPISEKFRSSTSIFEKVWYGERNVEETDFKMIYEQFNSLSAQINTIKV